MREVLVVVGPGVAADAALLGEVAEREFAALGVRGAVRHVRDAADLPTVADGVSLVVIPGPQLRAPLGRPVVRVDVERADRVEPGPGVAHIHGRGIAGVAWGIRHAVHRTRHPARRVPYGPERDQWGELYLPGDVAGVPVVALVHGGYWRSIWAADLMDALCADLAGRGLAVWNLEYRRPDLHGWAATTADVAAGLEALAGLDAPLDLGRVAVAGHSAGAQLALRAVADGAPVALAVSLAGVLDLVEADRRWLSAGAVSAALGGPAAERDRRVGRRDQYGAASPLLRLPLGVRQLVVQGAADDLDLVDFGRRYARAAVQAGDEVTYLEMAGDHFDVITPGTPIWQATAEAVTAALT
ncbi:alpha/beta hydrolase [Nonomuraea purpurea]|uniref:Alpha/beta hydrolase n=1 Tax=Nonomuraea purpurea TaxID=1849276 RepID=A0ABV8GAW6_9ACTN